MALLGPASAIAGQKHATASSAPNTKANLPPPARKPGWWAGPCDIHRTPGSYVGPIWHGLVSCGPGLADGGLNETGPVSANVEWQCVDLVERWLYLEFGVKQVVSVPGDPVPGTNGFQLVRHYAYAIAHQFKPGHYPLRKVVPATAQKQHDASLLGPGDVVSYGKVFPGHTNLVEKSTVGAGGNGMIVTLNQNLPLANGTDGPVEMKIPVSNWNFSIYGLQATGWLHVTGQPPPPPTKHHENPGPPTQKFQRCVPPAPFANGPGSPPLLAKGVGCAHARQVVSTWNQMTGGACQLDGSACQVLDFSCRIAGANLQTLVCTRQDGAEIRFDIGPY